MEREVGMGDFVILQKDATIVDGVITGFMMNKGEIELVFIEHIKSGFRVDEWEVKVADSEIQP